MLCNCLHNLNMASFAARAGLRALPYVVRGAAYVGKGLRTPAGRKALIGSAAKFLTWANRRKIASGYNKYVKPTAKRVVGRRVSRGVSRGMSRTMKSYRRRTP